MPGVNFKRLERGTKPFDQPKTRLSLPKTRSTPERALRGPFAELARHVRNLGFSLVGLLLALGSVSVHAQAPEGKRLPVEVWREAAQGRAVEFCLPLAQGELTDVNAVRVVNEKGQELPLQLRVLSRWPQDKSLRVLWLSVLSNKQRFSVEYKEGVKRSISPADLRVVENADSVEVSTGVLKFVVPKNGLKLLSQVWIDANKDGIFGDEETVLAGKGVVPILTTIEGKTYIPDKKAPEVVVEESGPLYVSVKISGELVRSDGAAVRNEDKFQVTYRIKAWKDTPALSVQHVLKRLGRTFRMDVPSEEETEYEWSALVPVDEFGLEVDVSAGQAGLKYAAGGEGKILDQGLLTGKDSRLIFASGDYASKVSKPNVRFKRDGKPLPGELRWLNAGNGKVGIGIAVRDAAELFPKAYEVSGTGSVRIDLWRDDPPDPVLEIGSGFHRTHDLVLLFHSGDVDASHGELACKLTMPSRAQVPASQLRQSGVFGPMPTSFDISPDVQTIMTKVIPRGEQRFVDIGYGDARYGSLYPSRGGRHGMPGSYSNPLKMYVDWYALTGRHEYFEQVDKISRWMRDWHLKHRLLEDGSYTAQFAEPSNSLYNRTRVPLDKWSALGKEYNQLYKDNKDKRRIGALGLVTWCRRNPCHLLKVSHFDAIIYHYYLTGDPETLETARGAGNFYVEMMTKWYADPKHRMYTRPDKASHRTKLFGSLMLYISYYYEGLGDKKYMDALAMMMGNHFTSVDLDKFPQQDTLCWYWWGVQFVDSPIVISKFCRSLYEYYRITKDERVKVFAQKSGDFIIDNMWDADRKEFFVRPYKDKKRTVVDTDVAKRKYVGDYNIIIASMLAHCYLVTGDNKFIEVAREAHKKEIDMIEKGKALVKFRVGHQEGAYLLDNIPGYYYAAEQAVPK